jgi:hypothetical protein
MMLRSVSVVFNSLGDVLGLMSCKCSSENGQVLVVFQSTEAFCCRRARIIDNSVVSIPYAKVRASTARLNGKEYIRCLPHRRAWRTKAL